MFRKLLGSSRIWCAATALIAALAMSGQAQAGVKAFGPIIVHDFLAFDDAGTILCDDNPLQPAGPGCAGARRPAA